LHQGVKPIRDKAKSASDRLADGRSKGGVGEHTFDWLNAGDGLFSEGEAERDGAEQFTIDINWAATHTLQNAGFSQRTAAKAGKDDGLPWTEIMQDTEDLDLEVFNAVSLEDGFADAMQPRLDVPEWEELLGA
jgi:hypothetical protein